ncbi:MAG: LPS export ABC transporter periplasmic protein LptC [Thermomonas sp.]|uniref:LPS export ABC transporter periplasmic protein LptC n=1 Tax=Thermomonas sp. TaxID=1971895 RepID=UPI0039E5D3EC
MMGLPPRWRAGLSVALLLAAIASGWSIWRQSRPADDGVLATRPDYVLREFEITSLDKQGKESFTLRGPEVHRNPADKTMEMATPLFLVPDRGGRYWQVRAQHGIVPADGGQLHLRGQVRADSPPNAPPATRIETGQLTLHLAQHRATTPAKVTVTRPGLTMQGIGMQADFDSQQVSLLSQVRTRYVPQH